MFILNLCVIFQILAALSVSLGSLVVGFSSAYTSPALVSMEDRNVTSFEVTPQSVCYIIEYFLIKRHFIAVKKISTN